MDREQNGGVCLIAAFSVHLETGASRGTLNCNLPGNGSEWTANIGGGNIPATPLLASRNQGQRDVEGGNGLACSRTCHVSRGHVGPSRLATQRRGGGAHVPGEER